MSKNNNQKLYKFIDSDAAHSSFTISGSSDIYNWLRGHIGDDLSVQQMGSDSIRISGSREAIGKTIASLREQGLLEDADIDFSGGFSIQGFESLSLYSGFEPEAGQDTEEEEEGTRDQEQDTLNETAGEAGPENASEGVNDPSTKIPGQQDSKAETDGTPETLQPGQSDGPGSESPRAARIIQDDGPNNGTSEEIQDVLGSFFTRFESTSFDSGFDLTGSLAADDRGFFNGGRDGGREDDIFNLPRDDFRSEESPANTPEAAPSLLRIDDASFSLNNAPGVIDSDIFLDSSVASSIATSGGTVTISTSGGAGDQLSFLSTGTGPGQIEAESQFIPDGTTNANTTDTVPALSSNNEQGIALTATGPPSFGSGLFNAFDEDATSHMLIDQGASITVEYENGPEIINKLIVSEVLGQPFFGIVTENFQATDYIISGSNDGTNYTQLASITGETGWTDGETREFGFTNSTEYSFYRLTLDGGDTSFGNDFSAVGEIDLVRAEQNNSAAIHYESSQIGNYSGGRDGTDLVLNFDPGAPAQGVEAVLEHLQVTNTQTDVPLTRDITVDFGSGVQDSAQVTLTPVVQISDAGVEEGGLLKFAVDLNTEALPAGQSVTVDYTLTGGSASSGTDFKDSAGTITFTPGQESKLVGIQTYFDNVSEGAEDLTITLSNLQTSGGIAAELSDTQASATGTITDFDGNLVMTDLFTLTGENEDDRFGNDVSGAGDVNGDGFDDFIISASLADPNGSNSGRIYVVFGGANFEVTGGLDAAALDGTNGFALNGIAPDDISGRSVSSAGDINGDGIDDLIIGSNGADANGAPNTGQSYVVFGQTGGFDAEFELSSLLAVNGGDGSNGFALNGIAPDDFSGNSVSSAGDVNGDGIDDLIIGASNADPNGSRSGESYVVFGQSGGFGAEFDLASLNGSNGFVLNGIDSDDQSGVSVSSAGDINGDGIDDILIGASRAEPNGSNSGQSYVVFGQTGGFTAEFDLGTISSGTGVLINGANTSGNSGDAVFSAGDINGDGFDDVIIGANRAFRSGIFELGESYIIFGDAAIGNSGPINAGALDGNNGFVFTISSPSDDARIGQSVSAAGDINGDGIDDLIIGAGEGDSVSGDETGLAYILYGDSGLRGGSATFDAASLDGTNGFVIEGVDIFDAIGSSVSSAGDVNGDGFDDILIADTSGSSAGESYVVFGGPGFNSGTVLLGDQTGTSGAEQIIGGSGDNTITGGGGADVLRGGAGDDVIGIGDTAFARLDGGNGFDTLRFDDAAGSAIDFTDVQNYGQAVISDFENLDMTTGANTVTLDASAVYNLTGNAQESGGSYLSNTLTIDNDGDDTINLQDRSGQNWGLNGTEVVNGTTYDVYETTGANASAARVLVADNADVTILSPFENPFGQAIDGTGAASLVSATGQAGAPASTNNPAHVITLAVYTAGATIATDGAFMDALATTLSIYQDGLAGQSVDVSFEILTQNAGSYENSTADVRIGLGDGFFDNGLNPDNFLGLTGTPGQESGDIDSDIMFSESYLNMAGIDGFGQGSLASYVLGQEIGHALGLDELADADLEAAGHDPAAAHEHTTLDESIEGLESLDQLDDYEFADTPGAAGFEMLAENLSEALSENVIEYEDGTPVLTGTADADIFRFDAIDMDSSEASLIKEFTQGQDVLDISSLISDFDPLQDNLDEFVIQTSTQDGLSIAIDTDGAQGQAPAVELATLEGMSAGQITADDLITQSEVV